MSTTLATTVRTGGRWLIAAAVVFVVGFALAVFVEPGGWVTELGVALPLLAAAVLLVIGTATAGASAPARPPAVGAVVAAVGCALGIAGLLTASMLGGPGLEGLYLPVATVTTALGGAAVAALAVALRGIAGRTGLVVAVLGVVVVLGCLFLDPIVPFVLAGVLGVPLARSGASATMSTMSRRQLAFAAGLVPVLVWAAVGTPAFVAELSTPCPTGICATFERPTPEAVGFYAALGLSPLGYALAVTVLAWAVLLVAAAVALLLPRSRSGGLLVDVTAVLLPVVSATGFGAALATRSAVGQVLDVVAGVVVGVLTPLLFGLFPDGRWHPRWFRWAWVAPAAVSTVSLAVPGLGDSDAVAFAELASWLLLVGVQVHRYRRADWAARQQTKLVLLAVVLVITNLVLGTLADLAGVVGGYQPVAVLLSYAALGALNVGLLVALFRFRLYDADLALRRTAVYAAALVVLAAVYVGLVAAAAPALSAAAVGVLALGGGLVVFALRERLRRRLFGGHGLARAIAAVARDPAPRSDLAATIANGLGLPYAAVYDHGGELVCESGEPPSEPHRESVVDGDGVTVGSLVLGPPRGTRRLDRHHRRVLAEVLPFVVLVLRARAEAQALKAARAAAAGAREDERRRLRRDLHDGVGPLLATQLLLLDTQRVTGRPELLAHLEEQARAAVGEVRRVAHDLRPAVLDAGGLPAALAAEAERVQVAGLPVELVVDLGAAVPTAAAEVAVLRIAQEALTNVVKHAGATTARVRLTADAHALELVVEDDGRGRAGAVDGIGTASMRERAAEIGGEVHIGARLDGRGTVVRVRVPR